jgi:O-antigen ligase
MAAQLELSPKHLPVESDAVGWLSSAAARLRPVLAVSPDWLALIFGAAAILAGGAIAILIDQLSGSATFLLLGIAAMVVVICAFARPEWGLLALVFTLYANFSDVLFKYHHAPSIAKPFIGLMVAVIFVRRFLYGERPSGWMRPFLVLAAYGLVGAFSLLYAPSPAYTQTALSDYAKDMIVAMSVIMLLQRAKTLRRVIWVLLAAGILMATLSIYQQFTGTFDEIYWGLARSSASEIGADAERRVSGPIGDPNFYAQILIVLVPLALDRLWSEPNRWLRLCAAWALSVASLTILFTYSRGGFLALIIALTLMWARRRPNLLTLLITVAAAVVLMQFAPDNYVERIKTIPESLMVFSGDTYTTDDSIRGRTSENRAAWMMFMDHPLTGVGLNNYPVLYQNYSRLIGMDPRSTMRAPHSFYLEIASQTGLLGLAAFGLVLWTVFGGLEQARKKFIAVGLPDYASMATAFSVGLTGYLTTAIFLHSAYPRFWWLLVGIAFSIAIVAKRELAARRGKAMVN